MNLVKTIIEVLDDINETATEIEPLQKRLNDKRKTLGELNEQLLFMSSLRDFLSKKILETYSDAELEEVGKYRKQVHPNSWIPTETCYVSSKVFDPYYDEWYIYNYERKGDKIRLAVSCKKNEGTISGLMTFLDTHYTNWFEISELEMLNDGL